MNSKWSNYYCYQYWSPIELQFVIGLAGLSSAAISGNGEKVVSLPGQEGTKSPWTWDLLSTGRLGQSILLGHEFGDPEGTK